MAFGFGFNKQKVLSAAEKFVQQGKLQNAIAEYEKVLKNDEKDLTVNNTIGDLYARLGDSEKAIECFKKVGDAYAAQGFTVKGIAMYKKLTKLQPSVDSSLKLAELYTQQGLFNDARAQYLQVAEDFMKAGDLDQAVRLFQKVLEMDPENVPMRVKLAEVYIRLGKKKEAWDIFCAAAESLRSRGSLAAAEDLLKRMQALDPGSSYVLLLRAKAALDSDDPKHAIEYLEKASDLDSHPEALRDLLKAYLQIGDLTKAPLVAEKLLTVHNDPEGLFLLAEGCSRLGQHHQALDVYTSHADRLLATDSAKLLSNLHTMIAHVRDDSAALDSLLLLLNKAGDSTHVNEVTELLAHASVKDGNLSRGRDLYHMLSTTEPQNQVHLQNYQQVLARLEEASPSRGITAEEGAVIVEELEAIAPIVDQAYPDDIAIAVRSAVTDADLFLSYNLPDKAIVPLLGVLSQAPRDARLNQRLAALHTRFHRFTEAAVCCRTLESVYHDAGYPDEAVRYGDLAVRYEQSASAAAPEADLSGADLSAGGSSGPGSPAVASSAASSSTAPHAPWPTAAASADADLTQPEFAVEEMAVHAPSDEHVPSSDLASEWEDSLSVDEPTAAVEADASGNPEVAETVEEIKFYLEHFMGDQARAGFEKLESLTSDARVLDPLRAAIESAGQPAAEPEPEIAEINADELAADGIPENEIPAVEISADEVSADEPATFEVSVESQPVESGSVESGSFESRSVELPPQPEFHHEIHLSAAAAPDPEPAHAEPAAAEPEPAAAELSALVADLEASLGDSFPEAPPPNATPLPAWPAATAQKSQPQPAPAVHLHFPTDIAKVAPQPTRQSATEISPAVPAVAASAAAAAAAPAMSYGAAPVRPLGAGAQAMHPAGGVDLSEMFGELKQELEEEKIAGDDDPETHYNLGVAFREMGLLDEAITELQKVCAAIDRGLAFSQRVQTYTWLAQCFLDKGVPEAAIRWYEKALNIPGLDDDARLAINYELGSACETAKDKPAALRHFTDVYGTNIDYRDVAERIQALKS